jgi:hypothetical protein
VLPAVALGWLDPVLLLDYCCVPVRWWVVSEERRSSERGLGNVGFCWLLDSGKKMVMHAVGW